MELGVEMKRGRRVNFHGAFGTKSRAMRKEASRPGSWIKRVKVRGHVRYVVMSQKG